jgi:hypothetical protein
MLKKILIGLVALVVVAAVGLYVLYSNLGSVVKAAIENVGSAATQAQVRVDDVTLSATSGDGRISGLTVGNPAGFSTPNAIVIGDLSVKVDVGSITKTPVVIKEIVIARPAVTYERGASGGNLEKIQDNVNTYAGGGGSKPASGGKDEPKVIIENLYVRDGQIAISHSALQGRTLSAGLPTIHLRDIGKDKGGATPAEVADKVLGAIAQTASKVASADLDKALGQIRGAVQEQIQRNVPANLPGNVGDRLKGVLGTTPK